jgi:hypothetical protein
VLASAQIDKYHCWSMEKTEHEMEVPAGIWCCKRGPNDAWMMEKPKEARGFWKFWQKIKSSKNARRREWEYSDLWRLCLGLQICWKWL